MIFLSHNYKDKPVVEQVALKLRNIYGQDKIFYDSWSIQPGDGIIDKMEEGLSNCKFFFFFISNNSLTSNMVKMEWQNAIFKAAQNAIRFIPIRMDRNNMPFLLTQTLYIDLFSYGIDIAIRQIVDVVEGTNTYRTPTMQFSNLVAYKHREGSNLIIECCAKYYLEPISSFLFCTQGQIKNICYNVYNESMIESGEVNNMTLNNGKITNAIYLSVSHGTLPDFPFIVEFSSQKGITFDIETVLHKISHKSYSEIPLFLK